MLEKKANPAELYARARNARDVGALGESEALAREILIELPANLSARMLLAELLLSQGRFAEGWENYEARFDYRVAIGEPAQEAPTYSQWKGEDLSGKSILVWPEQGFGDQIQFARYIPELVAKAARVTILVGSELAAIFDHFGADVLAISDGLVVPRHDFWTYPGSLPLLLGTLPSNAYLKARVPAPSPKLRIGLTWQGNSLHSNDENRRATPEIFRPLLDLNAQLVALSPAQTGAVDFAQTAAMIDQLDLVISVDTAVAHLAGAMGRPVYVLLPRIGVDWRWMWGKPDNPWYPTGKFFRQNSPGDWGQPVSSIRKSILEDFPR